MRVYLDQQAVGADGDRRPGHRGARLRLPVAWLGSRIIGRWVSSFSAGTAKIPGVAREGLESPDAALAQHHIGIAVGHDLFRRQQPLLDLRPYAALEQDGRRISPAS